MKKLFIPCILILFSSCINQNKKKASSVNNTKLDTIKIDLDLFYDYTSGTSNISNDYIISPNTPGMYRLKLKYYNGLKNKIKNLTISLIPTTNLIDVSKINDSIFDFTIKKDFIDSSLFFTIFLKPKKEYLIYFIPTKEFISSKDSLEGCQIGNLAPKFKFVN